MGTAILMRAFTGQAYADFMVNKVLSKANEWCEKKTPFALFFRTIRLIVMKLTNALPFWRK